MKRPQFMNYKQELVEAPEDKELILCETPDKLVVLSSTKGKGLFQVRYGLSVKTFSSLKKALEEFHNSLLHAGRSGDL